jgi:hypothetical protein
LQREDALLGWLPGEDQTHARAVVHGVAVCHVVLLKYQI